MNFKIVYVFGINFYVKFIKIFKLLGKMCLLIFLNWFLLFFRMGSMVCGIN